jgi:adenylyltransferase/sulfurtransferase
MEDAKLLRYGRQIMLPQIDIAGQEELLASKALIIGLGGLGSPVAYYLAAAGVGHLMLADHDKVELTNLQRQLLHKTKNIGKQKTDSAIEALSAINPEITLEAIPHKLEDDSLDKAVSQADVVIDGCDNFPTRFAVNRACVKHKKPLVSGAVIRFEGQVSVFDARNDNSPCYRCLYPEEGEHRETCSETGVLAPAAGIIGSIQATEAIKVLLGIGEPLLGRVLMMDALTMELRELKLKKDPKCPVCG